MVITSVAPTSMPMQRVGLVGDGVVTVSTGHPIASGHMPLKSMDGKYSSGVVPRMNNAGMAALTQSMEGKHVGDHAAHQPMKWVEKFRSRVQVKNELLRGALGEFFGTFLVVFIGLCVVAQFHLSNHLNSWIQINVGWGFAFMFAVFATMKVGGGHLNPAVSAMFYSFGEISTIKFIAFMAGQFAGGFLAAAATYIYYYQLIDRMEINGARTVAGNSATAAIFTTFGPEYLSTCTMVIDQVVGTAILCLFVAAIVDKRTAVPSYVVPMLVGFLIMMIGCGFGQHLGYPINPARDFGPRLFTFLIYGRAVFTYPTPYYFLIPLFAPFVGGVAGGWIYYLFAGYHIPAPQSGADGHCPHRHHGEKSCGGSGGECAPLTTHHHDGHGSEAAKMIHVP